MRKTHALRFVVTGVLLAIVLTAFLLTRRSSAPAGPPPSEVAREPVRPSPIAANIDLYATPVPEAPLPPARIPRESANRVDDTGTRDWAVVGAIYRDYDAAERRARSFTAQWRLAKPKVFPRRGEGAKYMVVLGSDLTRADAESLREQAREAGLPDDTYVTRIFTAGALTKP